MHRRVQTRPAGNQEGEMGAANQWRGAPEAAQEEAGPAGDRLRESPRSRPAYLPQLHSFPSVVMRRLWAAHDPETTVRTRTPDRHPYLWGPHRF